MVRYEDASEVWLQDLLDNHLEEALARADQLLERTTTVENGCMVTETEGRSKIRFPGATGCGGSVRVLRHDRVSSDRGSGRSASVS